MEGISTAALAPSSASLGQEAYNWWTLLLSTRLILALETLNCNSIIPGAGYSVGLRAVDLVFGSTRRTGGSPREERGNIS